MSRPSPTQFELDMARVGRKIGDPIPLSVTSRPDPGEYGGIYDEKKPARPTAPAAPVEQRQSRPEPQHGGGYQTRASTASPSRSQQQKQQEDETKEKSKDA